MFSLVSALKRPKEGVLVLPPVRTWVLALARVLPCALVHTLLRVLGRALGIALGPLLAANILTPTQDSTPKRQGVASVI